MASKVTQAGLAAIELALTTGVPFSATHIELGNTSDRSAVSDTEDGVRAAYTPRKKFVLTEIEGIPGPVTSQIHIEAFDLSDNSYSDATEAALLDSSDVCLAYEVKDAGAFHEKDASNRAPYVWNIPIDRANVTNLTNTIGAAVPASDTTRGIVERATTNEVMRGLISVLKKSDGTNYRPRSLAVLSDGRAYTSGFGVFSINRVNLQNGLLGRPLAELRRAAQGMAVDSDDIIWASDTEPEGNQQRLVKFDPSDNALTIVNANLGLSDTIGTLFYYDDTLYGVSGSTLYSFDTDTGTPTSVATTNVPNGPMASDGTTVWAMHNNQLYTVATPFTSTLTLTQITPASVTIEIPRGLEYAQGHLYLMTESGGAGFVYIVDTESGLVSADTERVAAPDDLHKLAMIWVDRLTKLEPDDIQPQLRPDATPDGADRIIFGDASDSWRLKSGLLSSLISNIQTVTAGIADLAVTTAKLANGAVTDGKIANDVNLPGAPTTQTPAASDNTNRLATTQYVTRGIATALSVIRNGVAGTRDTLLELSQAIDAVRNLVTKGNAAITYSTLSIASVNLNILETAITPSSTSAKMAIDVQYLGVSSVNFNVELRRRIGSGSWVKVADLRPYDHLTDRQETTDFWLDSPNTTSAVSYRVQCRSVSPTGRTVGVTARRMRIIEV